MDNVFVGVALALGAVLLIPFYRVYKGPTVFDRLLGVSTVGTKTIGMILLLGFLYGRIDMFVDISLGYAILNFVGGLAMAKYYKSETKA
ncbi:MAG: monovalent cation/H+ antiporter complex subunit F [Candidatus Krumholzibacteria bacterium]|jgi:multicomponent Na+:H+ antiporter subunit F|nr:monovalent cation/H+ antiporter complex subunit F [Candidatus Krumholzibacteria bacterium]